MNIIFRKHRQHRSNDVPIHRNAENKWTQGVDF